MIRGLIWGWRNFKERGVYFFKKALKEVISGEVTPACAFFIGGY